MFGLFTSSMFGTCVYLAMSNLTQVEKLGSKTRAYQLAVLKPSSKELQHVNLHESPLLPYSEITYPLDNGQNPYAHRWDIPSLNTNTSSQVPPSATSHVSQPPQKIPDRSTTSPSSNPLPDLSLIPENNTSEGSTSPVERAMNSPVRVQHHNLVQPLQQASSGGPQPDSNSDDVTRHAEVVSSRDIVATRTFAVLGMETGENPWDLGSRLLNLETVMGTSIFDYLFPVRRSPCCNHEDPESYYDLGPAVDIVKSKYNFMNAEDICENGGRRRSKRNDQSSRLMPQQS
jgi:palmitoyltransferase